MLRTEDLLARYGGEEFCVLMAGSAAGAAAEVVERLKSEGISTVVWATGHQPRYPWLDPALLDRRGAIRHDGGIMDQPGLYVLGLPFTRRRRSNLIAGVGPDAEALCAHLVGHLGRARSAA